MKKYILDLKVVSNERFASGHSLLKLTDESKALPEILPGQFVRVPREGFRCFADPFP